MFLTEDPHCCSLLRPNAPWLERFSFSSLFKTIETESVPCTTLDALVKEHHLSADIIKLDTQGLELPILRTGDMLLKQAFCVETETGFVENYFGETTYAQIDEFMRSKGFLLFDMTIHRVGRKNSLAEYGTHQALWCQAIWLFDYIAQRKKPTAQQALAALGICKALKFIDYGLELANYFRAHDLIDQNLLTSLERPENWLPKKKPPSSRTGKLLQWVSR